MEIKLKPEIEEKLNQIASQSGRQADQIVEELVETYIDHGRWFKQESAKRAGSNGPWRVREHDEVMARVERISG